MTSGFNRNNWIAIATGCDLCGNVEGEFIGVSEIHRDFHPPHVRRHMYSQQSLSITGEGARSGWGGGGPARWSKSLTQVPPRCHYWSHTQTHAYLQYIKIHPWRHSIVKTVHSALRIYCYFVLVRSGTIYGFNYETECIICHGLAILTMKLRFFISNLGKYAYIMCILSRRKISITIDS